MIDLWRHNFHGACRGGVCVSELRRRSYIGVWRGGVCVRELWRHSEILAFAEEVFVGVICVAAVVAAFVSV